MGDETFRVALGVKIALELIYFIVCRLANVGAVATEFPDKFEIQSEGYVILHTPHSEFIVHDRGQKLAVS